MTKEEFLQATVAAGYATKKSCNAYIKKELKSEYSEKDFIDVYRFHERLEDKDSNFELQEAFGINGKTTAFSHDTEGYQE